VTSKLKIFMVDFLQVFTLNEIEKRSLTITTLTVRCSLHVGRTQHFLSTCMRTQHGGCQSGYMNVHSLPSVPPIKLLFLPFCVMNFYRTKLLYDRLTIP